MKQTSAVGMYPDGAAVCKAQDMAGNVWEWCLNKYREPADSKVDASGEVRVRRGGSFSVNQSFAASAVRSLNYPHLGGSGYGLRLVVAAPIAGTDG